MQNNQLISVFRVETASCGGLEKIGKTFEERGFQALKRRSGDATKMTEA